MIPINKTLKFWDGLKEGKVYATQCRSCGKVFFPPNGDCSACLSSDVEWVEIGGEAEVEAFTHVIIRPTTFQQFKPYTVAIGKLKEGIKVFAWLTGSKLSEIKIGMKVKLIARISQEGNPTYEFVPL